MGKTDFKVSMNLQSQVPGAGKRCPLSPGPASGASHQETKATTAQAKWLAQQGGRPGSKEHEPQTLFGSLTASKVQPSCVFGSGQ